MMFLSIQDYAVAPDELHYPLFAEDKLVFGIYASAQSVLTLPVIRRVYNQADAKAIARQVSDSHHRCSSFAIVLIQRVLTCVRL